MGDHVDILLYSGKDDRFRGFFIGHFGREGHRVHLAETHEEVERILAGNEVPIAVFDVSGPRAPGYLIARAVEEERPHCHVVLSTGYLARWRTAGGDRPQGDIDDVSKVETLLAHRGLLGALRRKAAAVEPLHAPPILAAGLAPEVSTRFSQWFASRSATFRCSGGLEALRALAAGEEDAGLVLAALPDDPGARQELFDLCRHPGLPPVILIGRDQSLEIARQAFKAGAFDLVPPDAGEAQLVEVASNALRQDLERRADRERSAELQRRYQDLKLLFDLSASVGYTMDPGQLIHKFLTALGEMIPATSFGCLIESGATCKLHVGYRESVPPGYTDQVRRTLCGAYESLTGRRPVLTDLVRITRAAGTDQPAPGLASASSGGKGTPPPDPLRSKGYPAPSGTSPLAGYIHVPLYKGDRAVGILQAANQCLREFTLSHANALFTLANYLSQALEKLLGHLEIERNRLAEMMDSMSEGIVSTNEWGEILLLNASARRFLHVDSVAVKSLSELGNVLRGSGNFLAAEMLESEVEIVREVRFNRLEDEIVLEVQCRIVRDTSGQQTGKLVVLRDITQVKEISTAKTRAYDYLHKKKEELEEAHRVKDEFLANTSHELRTPLMAILGYATILLEEEGLGKTQEITVRRIRKRSKELLDLINDTLDLAKISAGKMVVQATTFPLATLVEDVVGSVPPVAGDRQVAVEFDLAGAPEEITSDYSKVKVILTNLLSNALKFTLHGRVVLGARLVEAAGRDEIVEFSVADTGIGIHRDDLAVIFEEFRQLDGSLTRKVGGTGLGLAIARKLAHLLSGTISVHSVLGEGSTFMLCIARQIASGKTERIRRELVSEPAGKPRRILVVDHNPDYVVQARRALRPLGYEIVSAFDGLKGLERARKETVNLILLDLQLRELSGRQFVEKLRADPQDRAIPVILTAADGETLPGREDMARLGVVGTLLKPYGPDELRDLVLGTAPPEGGRGGGVPLPSEAAGEGPGEDLPSLTGDLRSFVVSGADPDIRESKVENRKSPGDPER